MSSRKTEDAHLNLLNNLLSDRGLECARSLQESLPSSSSSGEIEEKDQSELEEEELKEEHVTAETETEIIEESQLDQPEIFPTPSLRQILPDKVRKIGEYNTLHVLPVMFRTDIDPALIPRIANTPQQKCIDMLADITGCTKYKKSLAEFWFLDTLANLLSRAQDDNMDRSSQAILILWFCEWIKEMQHFDAADRQRMMKRFKDNMLSAARFVAEESYIPTPKEAGVYYESPDLVENTTRVIPETKHLVTFEGASYECSLRDLAYIIHYIFDLFSTDYQYNLIRSVFTFAPDYHCIDAPYQIRTPKRLFAPLKVKPKKEKSTSKDGKAKAGKKKEADTEEYLALMELRAKNEREQEELEDKDREEWHRRCHILPLSFAADDEFFNKYWPPPPPETEPEPEPDVKGKGKGKGKK